MEAKELRIGNLFSFISTNSIEFVVDVLTKGIKTPVINNVSIKDIKPIPLTDEWLLKFGFEKDWCFCLEEHELRSNDGINYIYWVDSNYITDIQYVHQLQNLYYALTGKELEI